MINSNPRRRSRAYPHILATGSVLAFALFSCGSLEAGIISGSTVSGPITFGTVTAQNYLFGDFADVSDPASLVTITTGNSEGTIQLNTNSSPDYNTGDRLLLSITNGGSAALAGVSFLLTGTSFDKSDTIDPSRGAFSSNTYTSDMNQRLTSADVSISCSGICTQVSFTFDSTLAVSGTTYFYLPVLDNGNLGDFTLLVDPVQASSTTPEPAMILPLGLALIGLVGLRRRFGN